MQNLSLETLNHLADIACEAAVSSGKLIQAYTGAEVAVSRKEGGDSLASQVVTEVDERSQALILERVRPTMAQHELGLLTEELSDDGSRFKKDYFWCIDPLDGTLPFTQGNSGYAVSIALVRQDGKPIIGVVYDPVAERLYRAVLGGGLSINNRPWSFPSVEQKEKDTLRFCMDCTFENDPRKAMLSERMHALAKQMRMTDVLIETHGGAVGNACHVLEHPNTVYLKEPKPQLGGGSFWDFAATASIYGEAKAWVSDARGQPLKLNDATHSFFNHCGVFYCSDPELAQQLLAALKRLNTDL